MEVKALDIVGFKEIIYLCQGDWRQHNIMNSFTFVLHFTSVSVYEDELPWKQVESLIKLVSQVSQTARNWVGAQDSIYFPKI